MTGRRHGDTTGDGQQGPPGAAGGDGRTARALEEAMTVRPLRDGRYVVDTDGGTYVVALTEGECTCPDHAIRGAQCKHLRRVAHEVTAGATPGPDERRGVCAVCGRAMFVPLRESGPHLCDDHTPEVGGYARDRETGKVLLVTRVTRERADEFRTDEGRVVADYPTNADYGDHEPVVEAVYASGIRPDRDPADLRSYAFPASRLGRADPESPDRAG